MNASSRQDGYTRLYKARYKSEMDEALFPAPSPSNKSLLRLMNDLPIELMDKITGDLGLYHVMALHHYSQAKDVGVRVGEGLRQSIKWRAVFGEQVPSLWKAFVILEEWQEQRAPWRREDGNKRSDVMMGVGDRGTFEEHFKRVLSHSFDHMRRVIKRDLRAQALCFFLPADLTAQILVGGPLQELERMDPPMPCDEATLRDLVAPALIRGHWSLDDIKILVPWLANSQQLLNRAWRDELLFLANLHSKHPDKLKEPLAPETVRKNQKHVEVMLQRDARAPFKRPLSRKWKRATSPVSGSGPRGWRRFRYPHANLMPYAWCLELFVAVLKQTPVLVDGFSESDEEESDAPETTDRYKRDLWFVSWLTTPDGDDQTNSPQNILSRPKEATQGEDEAPPPCLKDAILGLDYIYSHGNGKEPRLRRWNGSLRSRQFPETPRLQSYRDVQCSLHSPREELQWLEAFIESVAWMERRYPDLAASAKSARLGTDPSAPLSEISLLDKKHRRLAAEQDWAGLAYHGNPETIVRVLLDDVFLLNGGEEGVAGISPLALYLPTEASSARAKILSSLMVPVFYTPDTQVWRLREKAYGVVADLVRHLEAKGKDGEGKEDGSLSHDDGGGRGGGRGAGLAWEALAKRRDEGESGEGGRRKDYPSGVEESNLAQFRASLFSLLGSGAIDPKMTVEGLLAYAHGGQSRRLPLANQQPQPPQPPPPPASSSVPTTPPNASPWADTIRQYLDSLPPKLAARFCYICRVKTHTSPSKPSMCHSCAAFNAAGLALSDPANLDLAGQTALVTGGRVNLGFHVALRLLRCGCRRVIVTSRYPRDAVARYEAEEDAEAWRDRLTVVGADFRSARDAFALVEVVKGILGVENRSSGARLDILVNNAAQTLTDPVEGEARAIERERLLEGTTTGSRVRVEGSYTPRVRGAIPSTNHIGASPPQTLSTTGEESVSVAQQLGYPTAESPLDRSGSKTLITPQTASSWVQTLADIPYEDLITAHSVNAFVPLILIRELLPYMSRPAVSSSPSSSDSSPSSLVGHIINVSSREGIFEHKRGAAEKARGTHVHTNMTKAALNMVTETEAASAWRRHRVAVNTVDPGYMSAAPEVDAARERRARERGEKEEEGKGMPISFEDGAGRVLWPVAVACKGGVVWGRFLKHYGAVEVEPGLGR